MNYKISVYKPKSKRPVPTPIDSINVLYGVKRGFSFDYVIPNDLPEYIETMTDDNQLTIMLFDLSNDYDVDRLPIT